MAMCVRVIYTTLIVLIVAILYQCVSVAGTDSDKRFLVDSAHWTEWSTYGACSVTCGVGVKTRQRQCSGGESFPVAQTCNGKSSETAECNLRSCSSLSYCNLGPIGQNTITASSETRAHPASGVFTDQGWCAANKQNNEWLEVDFPNGFGVKRFNISSIYSLDKSGAYPKSVLVQYTPEYGHNFIDFPLQSGPLVIELNQTGSSAVTIPGFPVKKLRFTLKEFVAEPCMKLEVSGCPLKDLCTPSCSNGGICDYENHCSCMNGFDGDTCERKLCTPAVLGIYDGRIPQSDIIVSSQDPNYPKSELGLTTADLSLNKGWCAAVYDPSPWIQISLPEPMSISSFIFSYIQGHYTNDGVHTPYMKTFDLQYIPPTDSSRTPLTYADDIPSLDGTHPFRVTLVPPVVTDTIRIISHTVVKRACFKFEVEGCDPKDLCQAGWCLNGGSCVGENICKCMQGFFGNRCDKTSTDISTQTITFLNITQGQLYTTLYTFQVTGSVAVQTINTTNIVVINGANSHIMLDKDIAGSECLTNLDKCQNGFTLSIDVKFGSLLNNTYIVSSGGDLPNHAGIALFYANKTLTYIVTTSTQTWRLTVSYVPVLNVWQKFEITWDPNLGIGIFLNGKLLSTHSRPKPVSVTQTSQFCIGCSPGQTNNVLVNMQISQIRLWTVSRTELVNAGIVQAPIVTTRQPIQTPPSTAKPGSTAIPTTTEQTTLHTSNAEKSTTTSTSTKISTTPTTTTTQKPTTSQPIPAFHWNLTTIHNNNVVIGQKFNLTIHGTPIKTNTGLVFKNTTQFIDLGQIKCLLDPLDCVQGLTVQFMINVKVTSENTYLLTSGGELPNGIGIAVIYRYGQYQFVLTTTTKSWYANCGKEILTPHKFHLVMITWKENIGLEIIVDNKQVEIVNTAVNHQVSFTSSAIVYFGKQPPSTVKYEYVLQTVSIWYAHVDILVIEGLCPKPDRPVTINGGWSSWNGWTACSVTCNTGIQSRERTCTNPAPSNGGVGCPGNRRESRVCTAGPCAGWTHWFDGTCSASCGQGQRERLRHCSTGHDNDCPGDAYEIVTCYGDNC